ncbi:MAG TPA: TadE family protein [Acidimicrobiales bacterium]
MTGSRDRPGRIPRPWAVPRRRPPSGDQGQATAELAVVLPFIAVLLLGLVYVGWLIGDHIMATHAAREGARAAAVDSDPRAAERAARAAGGLDPRRLRVETRNRGHVGDRVTVAVRYRTDNPVPLLRWLVDGVTLTAEATMRVER